MQDFLGRIGQSPLQGLRRHGSQLGSDVHACRTQATGGRTDGISRRAHESVGVVAPREGQGHEMVQCAVDRCGQVGIETGTNLDTAGGFDQGGKGLGDLQGEPVECVEGPGDGCRRSGSSRQCADVGRNRVDQIWAGAQQLRETGVVAMSQVVGEAAHPSNVTHPTVSPRLQARGNCPP